MTSRRLVVFFPAFQAECIATHASYCLYHAKIAELCDVLTRLDWAPLHELIMVCELFAVPINILSVIIDAIIVSFVLQIF